MQLDILRDATAAWRYLIAEQSQSSSFHDIHASLYLLLVQMSKPKQRRMEPGSPNQNRSPSDQLTPSASQAALKIAYSSAAPRHCAYICRPASAGTNRNHHSRRRISSRKWINLRPQFRRSLLRCLAYPPDIIKCASARCSAMPEGCGSVRRLRPAKGLHK